MATSVPGTLEPVRKLRYNVSAGIVKITSRHLLTRVVLQIKVALQFLKNILTYLLKLGVEGMESNVALECR